jgi:hypothetical protein
MQNTDGTNYEKPDRTDEGRRNADSSDLDIANQAAPPQTPQPHTPQPQTPPTQKPPTQTPPTQTAPTDAEPTQTCEKLEEQSYEARTHIASTPTNPRLHRNQLLGSCNSECTRGSNKDSFNADCNDDSCTWLQHRQDQRHNANSNPKSY